MDSLKEAFFKIKEEINGLKNEINSLKNEINFIKIHSKLNISNSLTLKENKTIPTNYLLNNLDNSNKQTMNSLQNNDLESLKQLKNNFSIGNDGVPTDKPTDNQTDNQTDKKNIKTYNFGGKDNYLNILSNFEKAQMIISSLDDVKKDIRKTFKNLTHQEMLVFSTLYSYEDQNYENIDYKIISNKLNLSESSIRDYINKLIKKGIPITKKRLNNKKIILSIAPTLKEITNLSTIIKLRDL